MFKCFTFYWAVRIILTLCGCFRTAPTVKDVWPQSVMTACVSVRDIAAQQRGVKTALWFWSVKTARKGFVLYVAIGMKTRLPTSNVESVETFSRRRLRILNHTRPRVGCSRQPSVGRYITHKLILGRCVLQM
jgi:hypothetical protein